MIEPAWPGRIRLLALDVDGVLTDNGISVGPDRRTAGRAQAVRHSGWPGPRAHADRGHPGGLGERAALRGHDHARARASRGGGAPSRRARKGRGVGALLARRRIGWEDTAFVGDDLADLQVLRRVGLPIAVANAVEEVKAVAAYVTRAAGGHGAVREVVEMLLKARGRWTELLERYFTEQAIRAV